MKESAVKNDPVISEKNERLNIIVNSQTFSVIGPWHFDEHSHQLLPEQLFDSISGFSIIVTVDKQNYLVHPDSAEHVSNLINSPDRNNNSDFQLRLISPSGEERMLHGFGRVDSAAQDEELKEGKQESTQSIPVQLLEHVAGFGYWVFDVRANSLFFSEGLYDLYGFKHEAFASRAESFTRYIHPDDYDEYQAWQRDIRGAVSSKTFRYRIVTPNREVKWLEEKTEYTKQIMGETCIIGVVKDVTREVTTMETVDIVQKKLEEVNAHVRSMEEQIKKEWSQKKQWMQRALDAIPQLVWIGDASGNFLAFNDRWHSYTGLTEEASAGFHYIKSGLIHPSQAKEAALKWEAALSSGMPYTNETLLRNIDGDYQWHLDTITPIKGESGAVELWVGSLTNVNEEFNAEKNIKETNDLLEAIFNSSINGIQVLESVRDENTHKILDFEWKYFNRVVQQFFSCEEDLTNKRLSTIYPHAIGGGLFEKLKDVTLTGEPAQFEHYFQLGENKGWLEISAVKLEDGVVATFQNITSRKQAMFDAEESKHFIQQIANSSPDIIYVLDLLKESIVYVNGKVKDFLGYEEDDIYELGPAALQKLMHPEDFDRRMLQVKELSNLQENETREIEVRFKTVSGEWRWFRIRDSLFKRTPEGKVWQVIGLATDIDDLKDAKDRVFLQHQIDRQAEKIAQIGNWQWNLTTEEVVWGENLYRLLERDPSEKPTFKIFLSSVHPQDRAFFFKEIARIKTAEPGPVPLFYFRVLKQDGTVRHLRAAGELIIRNGERFVIGTVRDVTQDIINEKEIRERINLIETLVESNVNRIAVVDRNLRYLIWNKKCEELYGLKKSQVLGKTMREVYPKIDEKPVVLKRIQRALKGEFLHFPSEKSFGSDNYYESFYIPLRNDVGGVYAVLNILHDITDKVHAQLQLQELNESLKMKNHELKMMNEQLSTFAFVASHDLREPLRKIQVFSNSIMASETKNLSERGKDYFTKIISSIGRMNNLIDDILSFSRIHGNQQEVAPVDLNEVASIVRGDLSEWIKERKAIIECENLPHYRGNRTQLIQLFQNLLTNALKFQRRGNEPRITIRAFETQNDNIDHPAAKSHEKYLCLEFADNGIGFEDQYQSKIFQMFQRLHVPSQYTGTGMGLAICKKVLENHNGFIVAKSTPGAGSVFSCYFPILENSGA